MTRLSAMIGAGALSLIALAATADAAVVSFDGAVPGGPSGGIVIETVDPVSTGGFIIQTDYDLAIDVTRGGQSYSLDNTLSEFTVFGFPFGGDSNPYTVVAGTGGTVTFTADDPGLLAPGSLETLTLQFASAFTGAGAADFANFLVTTALVSFEAKPLGEAAFSVVIGAEGVPLPGAAVLFLTGAALIRRLQA